MQKVNERATFWIGVLIGVAVLTYGVFRAIDLRWVSDDAFITFRYVQNFLAGLGPVYNAGEHVEGYTHFLWFIQLSIAGWFGADIVGTSEWLGIASFAGTLLIFLRIAKLENDRSENPKRIFLPLAAALLALNLDMTTWASGGLETSFYTFLISLSFYLWFYAKLSYNLRLLSVGSVLILTTLTRPDGALFTLTALVLLFFKLRKDKTTTKFLSRSLFQLITPSLIIGIPYLVWKYSYYGDILPNTYYQKSGGSSYFGQGFEYIYLFASVYWSAAIGVMILPVIPYLRDAESNDQLINNDATTKVSAAQSLGSPMFAASIMIVVYLVLYVARVGGDFMFGRFIVPVLPLVYFVIERYLERDLFLRKYRWAFAALLVGILAFIENPRPDKPMYPNAEQAARTGMNSDTNEIADERFAYIAKRFRSHSMPISQMDAASEIGKYYEPLFRGLKVSVMIPGAENMIAYYGQFWHCIDLYGLCDSFIAHSPMLERGRAGHEKRASENYLRKRGVLFAFGIINYDGDPPAQRQWNVAFFTDPALGLWQSGTIINVDTEIFSELIRRFRAAGNLTTYIPDFPRLIPDWIANVMPRQSLSEVVLNYSFLKNTYFNRYPNPAYQKQIEDFIESMKGRKAD